MAVPKFWLCFICVFACVEGIASRPNIVLVLTDDMGYSDVGSYGGEIDTPSLDALAIGGLRFSAFYNSARCSPTRAALLTGRYPHDVQMGHLAGKRFAAIDGYRGDLDADAATLPELLKPLGYYNAMVGKWHVSSATEAELSSRSIAHLPNTPRKRGFDSFYGTLLGGNNFFSPKFLFRDEQAVTSVAPGYYYTDAISSEAVRVIETHEQARPTQPLFLYVAYTAPHWPIQAPEATVDHYRERYASGWEAVRQQRWQGLQAAGIASPAWSLPVMEPRDQDWSEASPAWQSERMAVHAAMVDHVDQGVGQIVQALARADALDDTLIVFLSDNGASAEDFPAELSPALLARFAPYLDKYAPASGEPLDVGNNPQRMPGSATELQSIGRPWAEVSNTPFRRYKSWVHEGGIATPLILHWPNGLKAVAGSVDHEPGHVVDLLPTLLSVAGADAEQIAALPGLDGESLDDSLAGAARQRSPIFFEHEGHRAVRDGRWKLVAAPDQPWALYDMLRDRTETSDLAARHPAIVAALAAAYDRYAAANKVQPWAEVLGRVEGAR